MTHKIGKSEIGNNAYISPEANVQCLDLKLGDNVYIGPGSQINCRKLEIGHDTYIPGDVWIEGRLDNLETEVKIGYGGLICQGTRINCNYPVEIGNIVGIGQNSRIWTHGYYPDRLSSNIYNNGKVTIGDNAWIIDGTTILPGVNIGDWAVVLTNSVVSKDIDSGALAGGNPAKMIKENKYPLKLAAEEKTAILEKVIADYKPIMKSKGFNEPIQVDGQKIYFSSPGTTSYTIFDTETRTIDGKLDGKAEDFRSHLLAQRVPFFTKKPFSSITPTDWKKLLEK